MSRTTSAPRSAPTQPRLAALSRGITWEAQLVMVVCAIALALRLVALNAPSSDYDEGVYWQSLRAMAAGHPLFTSIFSSQPPFFLLSIYPFYKLFGQTLAAGRLAVVVYSLVGIGAIYVAGRAIGGRWCGLAACALLAADPLYLLESRTLQAEVPALAFALLCVAFAASAMRSEGRRRRVLAALSGVALGLGIMVKLFDVVTVIPAALYLAQPIWASFVTDGHLSRPSNARFTAGIRAALPDLLLLAGGTILACVVVLLPYVGSWDALYDQVVRFHLVAARAVNRGLRYNLALLAKDGYEYPVTLAAITAVALGLWRRAWAIVPPLLWLLASLVLLVRQQPLFDHHRALLAPALALTAALALPLAAQAVARLPNASGSRAIHLAPVVTLLLVLVTAASLAIGAAGTYAPAPPFAPNEPQMAAALRAATVPDEVVVTDDQYVAGLADRDVPPQLVDTSLVRIHSGYLTGPQLEGIITSSSPGAILFASGRFQTIPGFQAWVDANYTKVATFGSGQALYLRVPKGPATV